MYTGRYYLVSVFRDELFVVAALKEETPPLLVIEFLHRTVDVMVDYFGAADEMSIKDNFSTCYQVNMGECCLNMGSRRGRACPVPAARLPSTRLSCLTLSRLAALRGVP